MTKQPPPPPPPESEYTTTTPLVDFGPVAERLIIPRSTPAPARIEPVDIRALMESDPPATEWFAEPVVPAGKLVGIVAKRGEGKSLLSLDLIAAKAAGRSVLGHPPAAPVHVVYLDLEMGPDDLYDRLADLGYTADAPDFDALVEHLHYYQLPALPPLDTEAGGVALEGIVERHHAVAVVIDTVARVVGGEENSAEPYRNLFRHTETRLKRRGITVVRLDHFGKDPARGSRGSSAKEDALDVVWELSVPTRHRRVLTCTKGRQAGIGTGDQVALTVETRNGIIAHAIPAEPAEPWLAEFARQLDRLKVPGNATVSETQKALKEAGIGKRRADVARLVKHRTNAVPKSPEPPSGTTARNRPEPTTPEPTPDAPIPAETTTQPQLAVPENPGTARNCPVPGFPPPRGGTGRNQAPCADCPEPATTHDRDGQQRCERCVSWNAA